MCIIVDTNCLNDLNNPQNEDMKPVRDWLKKHGSLIYTTGGKYGEELKHSAIKNQLVKWRQSNQFKQIKQKDKLEEQENQFKRMALKSDDPHILALAKVANVKVLVSQDIDLHADFTNPQIVGGKVYQKARHAHLLKKDTCPK